MPAEHEPAKGSNTTSAAFELALTILSTTPRGNCAGWPVLSFDLLSSPVVTLGNSQTSDGFFPSGWQRNLPFFFWFGYLTFGSRISSTLGADLF